MISSRREDRFCSFHNVPQPVGRRRSLPVLVPAASRDVWVIACVNVIRRARLPADLNGLDGREPREMTTKLFRQRVWWAWETVVILAGAASWWVYPPVGVALCIVSAVYFTRILWLVWDE